MIVDLFASLTFYLVPYLTGRFFTKKAIAAWIVGAFIWFVLFFVLSSILSLLGRIENLSKVIRIVAALVSLISIILIAITFVKDKPKINFPKDFWVLSLAIFVSLVYFLIWKRNTPYPLGLNWDIYEHIALANLIAEGKISFLTSNISDTFTFNSYSAIFHLLLSLPKIIFQKSLLGIYWWLEYWHYILTIFASFLLAEKIFNNKIVVISSVIVASLVFESLMVYSSLFLIPQTMAALIAVFVFKDLREWPRPYLVLAGLVILLMHYIIGLLAIVILIVGLIAHRFYPSEKLQNIAVFASTLIVILLSILNLKANWNLISREEASHFSFSILEKIGFLADWYSVGLFILMALGFITIVKKGNFSQKLILIFALLTLGLSLAPFSYFLKFYVLGRYFVNIVIAAGVGVLLLGLPKFLKVLGFVYLAFFLVLNFYKNQLVYKDPLRFGNLETHISKGEIEAGNWLFQNKKGNEFLISDPATQYVLEPVSEINTQGGAYMNLKTRSALISINNSYDSSFIKDKLASVHDELESQNRKQRETLFSVGGRYLAWQRLPKDEKESVFYNIWSPKKIRDEDKFYIDFLMNDSRFKLIFRNSELAIFKIK